MDLTAKLAERERLIKTSTADGTFVKWSDDAVETKKCLYILKVIAFSFPIQEFAGFEEVEAPEILKEMRKFLTELESLCEIVPEPTELPDSNENDENDRNDDEDDKSSDKEE